MIVMSTATKTRIGISVYFASLAGAWLLPDSTPAWIRWTAIAVLTAPLASLVGWVAWMKWKLSAAEPEQAARSRGSRRERHSGSRRVPRRERGHPMSARIRWVIRLVCVFVVTVIFFALSHAHITLPALSVVGLIALVALLAYLAIAANRKGTAR